MLGRIALDGARVPHTAGFSGLFFVAHTTKFTRNAPKLLLDRLLNCLTCERWAKALLCAGVHPVESHSRSIMSYRLSRSLTPHGRRHHQHQIEVRIFPCARKAVQRSIAPDIQ